MRDIRTTDYVAEYEFRRSSGPKYQTTSLRPYAKERRLQKPDEEVHIDNGRVQLPIRHVHGFLKTDERPDGQTEKGNPGKGESRKLYLVRQASGIKLENKVSELQTKHVTGSGNSLSETGPRKESLVSFQILRKNKGEKKSSKHKKNAKTKGKNSGKKKNGKRKSVKKVTGSMKKAIADMENSANASWDMDQQWDEASSWDFAVAGASSVKGFRKGIEEVIQVIVKVIKAVAATTLLPILLIMTGCLFIVITVLWASSNSGGSWSGKRYSETGIVTEKQIIYDGLMETFEGNEEAVIGVMCALMAESGCDPKATEAVKTWGISSSEYTSAVNDGTVTKEEFINSTYYGVQGSRGYGIAQWSTAGRKKALYEYAVKWADNRGVDFDIGDIEMQVAHLQETINTTYVTLKQALISETDAEEACYKWIATYERPSEKYSTWREKAQKDVDSFADDLRAECENEGNTGYFIWPCPSSRHITSYFGNRVAPKQGASTDHKGIDIGATMGADVIAAAAGKVKTVAYSSARGYYIVVDHGNDYETLYQHLSRQDVRTGDMVKAGQQIGAVGETGISTGPHLHFEIHVDGKPADPLLFYE